MATPQITCVFVSIIHYRYQCVVVDFNIFEKSLILTDDAFIYVVNYYLGMSSDFNLINYIN